MTYQQEHYGILCIFHGHIKLRFMPPHTMETIFLLELMASLSGITTRDVRFSPDTVCDTVVGTCLLTAFAYGLLPEQRIE